MSGALGIGGERTAMHEQTFHKYKEELDDERLVYEPDATSSGGSIYAIVHSHSETDVKSIKTQCVGVTRRAPWRTGSNVHLTGDANISSKHINPGNPGRTKPSRNADAFVGGHFV